MPSKEAKLDLWLHEHGPVALNLAAFQELLGILAPISESTLRRLLRASGASLHPLVAGVDQESSETLAWTLTALSAAYETGAPDIRRIARSIVITAKDHAKLVVGNPRVDEEKRRQKERMVESMLIWLENPDVYPLWEQLRSKSVELD